jgi:hypothetical protein
MGRRERITSEWSPASSAGAASKRVTVAAAEPSVVRAAETVGGAELRLSVAGAAETVGGRSQLSITNNVSMIDQVRGPGPSPEPRADDDDAPTVDELGSRIVGAQRLHSVSRPAA